MNSTPTPRVALAALLALALAGAPAVAGGDEPPAWAQDPPTSAAGEACTCRAAPGLFDRIRAGQVLKVGVFLTPPFCARVGGKLRGFDIALAERLEASLGAKFRYVVGRTDQQLDRLLRGEVDLVIAGHTITARRALRANFSRRYLTVTQAALVDRRRIPRVTREGRELETPLRNYFDLARISGLRIAVSANTEVERQARQNFPGASIVPKISVEAMMAALWNKKVDAVVHDSPVIEFFHQRNRDQARRLRAVLGRATTERLGIAVRKGDPDFLRYLDTFLQELSDQGVLRSLYRAYVRDDGWMKEGGS